MTAGQETILVVDFGSQYSQLIARRIREMGVYARLMACTDDLEKVREVNPVGIILSGGPSSVLEPQAPRIDPGILELGIPVLGICYGLQLIAELMGGEVRPSKASEYGRKPVNLMEKAPAPFDKLPRQFTSWMSHGDQIHQVPEGFRIVAESDTCHVAAMAAPDKRIYGVQFHPEVRHTEQGDTLLRSFVKDICGAAGNWSMERFEQDAIQRIRKQVDDHQVIGGVSGGVDSSVMAVLLQKAIGNRFTGIFVDNGLLRKNERETVTTALRDRLGVNLKVIDATDIFLDKLQGVTDPEEKRKIIGHTFIDVFEEEASKITDAHFLAQGTLYPDVIESVSFRGPSDTIKSHHNVGGLPDEMNLELVEPLRELFKDEVRNLGLRLGLDEDFIHRHPFPGPGLAVRILGDITRDRLKILQEADAIFLEELQHSGWYHKVSQALAVLLPVRSVGVMGDSRTYEHVIALRSVDTWDFMTADFSRLPLDLLGKIAGRIINEVKGVNRVVYDISSKPPATVEWE